MVKPSRDGGPPTDGLEPRLAPNTAVHFHSPVPIFFVGFRPFYRIKAALLGKSAHQDSEANLPRRFSDRLSDLTANRAFQAVFPKLHFSRLSKSEIFIARLFSGEIPCCIDIFRAVFLTMCFRCVIPPWASR